MICVFLFTSPFLLSRLAMIMSNILLHCLALSPLCLLPPFTCLIPLCICMPEYRVSTPVLTLSLFLTLSLSHSVCPSRGGTQLRPPVTSREYRSFAVVAAPLISSVVRAICLAKPLTGLLSVLIPTTYFANIIVLFIVPLFRGFKALTWIGDVFFYNFFSHARYFNYHYTYNVNGNKRMS